jgi:hypothetical protein
MLGFLSAASVGLAMNARATTITAKTAEIDSFL